MSCHLKFSDVSAHAQKCRMPQLDIRHMLPLNEGRSIPAPQFHCDFGIMVRGDLSWSSHHNHCPPIAPLKLNYRQQLNYKFQQLNYIRNVLAVLQLLLWFSLFDWTWFLTRSYYTFNNSIAHNITVITNHS
jgi:hypothetical protein